MSLSVRLIVNAGGDSRRMGGVKKALLPVPPTGQPLITYIIDRLSPLACDGVVVVANHDSIRSVVQQYAAEHRAYRIDIVGDQWPETGSLGGVATGLTLCREWAIVVACDMPFLNPELFQMMLRLAQEREPSQHDGWDVVAPRVHGFPQMLHTLYNLSVLSVMRQQVESGNYKLLDILPALNVRYVDTKEMEAIDPGLRSLTNINTPQEWEAALRLMADR